MAKIKRTLEECEALKQQYITLLGNYPVNDTYVVITGGNITNQNTSYGASNPHELQKFMWQVKYTEVPGQGTIKHIAWCLTGDYPFDLEINTSGTIQGTIWMLNEQPWISDILPKEKMKYDGSNWDRIGRPAGNSYTCNFYVSRVYEYTPPAPTTSNGSTNGSSNNNNRSVGSNISGNGTDTTPKPVIYKTSPILHTIKLVRSHTIDNYVIAKAYVSEIENVVELSNPPGAIKVNKMNFNIGNKYYGLEEFDELLRVHPGPWPNLEDL